MHGGFLAGPVVVLTAAIGHAVSGSSWDRERVRQVGVFLLAAGLCGLAALVNPYGIGLYGHVGRLLVSSGVTDLIDEYQPIPFGKPHARAVELTVIALIALPTLTAHRMRRYDLVQSLVWLHLSLASVRNAPLFALAVAPGLCGLLAGRSETDESISRWSFWPMTAACGMLALTFLGVTFGRFDRAKWPLDALATVNAMPVDAPLFHEQDWGGLVESETRPVRRAFVDDRFELFGREALLQYLNAIEGGRTGRPFRIATPRPSSGSARRVGSPAVCSTTRPGGSDTGTRFQSFSSGSVRRVETRPRVWRESERFTRPIKAPGSRSPSLAMPRSARNDEVDVLTNSRGILKR